MFSKNNKWVALYVLCMGTLMIVLDTTIVNVALPSISADLGFNETSLAWVVNAYMLTFGGFLLLGGRLGDIYGNKKMYLIGIALFTLASLLCGLASSQAMLVFARGIQGLGGAVASAVALSVMMNLFSENAERAKAMGFFGFVAAGGGSIGALLGGVLTGAFNWHSIFLINVPLGIVVLAAAHKLLPESKSETAVKHLDVWGATTITTSLVCAIYAIVNGNIVGWVTLQTLGLLGVSALLFALFIRIESRIKHPLMPLSLWKHRNLRIANTIGIMWSAAMFAWFFISALYMQLVLGYTPMQIGLSFLPSNIIMAIFSLGLSAKMVARYGVQKPIIWGMSALSLGLFLFAYAPVNGDFVLHILPAMLLLGLGAGMALNPVLLAAMSDAPKEQSGLASGIANTAFMLGGALGLAVLASVASIRSSAALAQGVPTPDALTAGYQLAFLIGTLFAVCAAYAATKLRVVFSETDNAPMHH